MTFRKEPKEDEVLIFRKSRIINGKVQYCAKGKAFPMIVKKSSLK